MGEGNIWMGGLFGQTYVSPSGLKFRVPRRHLAMAREGVDRGLLVKAMKGKNNKSAA